MGIIRKTTSVKHVLSIFEQLSEAISVVELIDRLKDSMNKTTVYRILDRLEQDGVLHSFKGKDGLKWYASCNDCHAGDHSDAHLHFQCNSCGKVECLSHEVKIPVLPNRKIDDSAFLLIGQCEQCHS